ncbi:unnamed protein product [Ilex paraguariensis]|uniref:Uncharacterized protein n=1 Tax=Ilex paraguariensis TaxID=185542 RepID=A0ABC8SHC3_9AQUA
MASNTVAYSGRAQIAQNESDTPFSSPLWPSSRRSPFFSSSPSLSSNSSLGSLSFHDDNSPTSPTNPPFRFSGIPFSWEHLPGIPKQQLLKKKDPSLNLLPLPPAGTPTPSKKFNYQKISPNPKKYNNESFRKDPFFAALVECSKDDRGIDTIGSFWKGSKVSRTLSDRLGFTAMNASCKRTCAVSESIVYLPRSSTHALFNSR